MRTVEKAGSHPWPAICAPAIGQLHTDLKIKPGTGRRPPAAK